MLKKLTKSRNLRRLGLGLAGVAVGGGSVGAGTAYTKSRRKAFNVDSPKNKTTLIGPREQAQRLVKSIKSGNINEATDALKSLYIANPIKDGKMKKISSVNNRTRALLNAIAEGNPDIIDPSESIEQLNAAASMNPKLKAVVDSANQRITERRRRDAIKGALTGAISGALISRDGETGKLDPTSTALHTGAGALDGLEEGQAQVASSVLKQLMRSAKKRDDAIQALKLFTASPTGVLSHKKALRAVDRSGEKDLADTLRGARRKGGWRGGLIGALAGAGGGALLGAGIGKGPGALLGAGAGGLLGTIPGTFIGRSAGFNRGLTDEIDDTLGKEAKMEWDVVKALAANMLKKEAAKGRALGLGAKALIGGGIGAAALGGGIGGLALGRRGQFSVMNTPLGVVAGERKDLNNLKSAFKSDDPEQFRNSIKRVVPVSRPYANALVNKQQQMNKSDLKKEAARTILLHYLNH